MDENWVLEYRSEDGTVELENLDGVPWEIAPLPRRFHRCAPQTRGWISMFTRIKRCACGGINYGGIGWFEKNSRRER